MQIGSRVKLMKVYLDNCCYNRPYDDQSYIKISLEAQAKIKIQDMIKNNEIELVSSFMSRYEAEKSPYDIRKTPIMKFITENTSYYVPGEIYNNKLEESVKSIMATGVKFKDAVHVACAIYAGTDFFLSTDVRLLKYRTDSIKLLNPIRFIEEMEV